MSGIRGPGSDPGRVGGARGADEVAASGAADALREEVAEVPSRATRTDRAGSASIAGSAIEARLRAAMAEREAAGAPRSETVKKLAAGEFTPRAKAAHDEIAKLLKTGITDWAVTDCETKKIVEIMQPLSNSEWCGLVREMKRTGHFDKFAKDGLKGSDEAMIEFENQLGAKLGFLPHAPGIQDAMAELGVPGYEGRGTPAIANAVFHMLNPGVH
jgi:hypothetical protein